MLGSYIRRILKKVEKREMIIAIGDIHGKINDLSSRMDTLEIDHPVNFVHLGDFGLGFDSPIREYKKLKDLDYILSKTGSNMFIIRGNHDNPAFWDKSRYYEMDNIQLVKDDTIIEIAGKVCYFAGGAISIDRVNRNLGVNYWKGEGYVRNDPNVIPTRIDHVFTHDVYHACSPFRMFSPITSKWFEKDPLLLDDLQKSQDELKNLYEMLMGINQDFSWYHGHYHESHTTIIENQKTYGLSIMEFKEVL